MKSFSDYLQKNGYTKWYKSNRPIKRYDEIGSIRINNKLFKKLEEDYERAIRSGKVRNGIYYHQYRNGTININGEKFVLYSVKDAIKIWRKKHPINSNNIKNY